MRKKYIHSPIIYKTTNLITGKIYVGQHYTSADDGYLGSGLLIKKAIKKYGKEIFIRETLEYCDSKDIDNREIYWISLLESDNEYVGYNISKGGIGKITISDKTKLRMSDNHADVSGENNPNYGNKWNDIQRKSLSDKTIGRYLDDKNPIWGIQRSYETKIKIKNAKVGNLTDINNLIKY
jgi:group I intron endonuclease